MISALRQLINSMNGVRIIPSDTTVEEEKSVSVSKVKKYRISPLIKSMETGIKVSEDISDEYNKGQGAGLNLFLVMGYLTLKFARFPQKSYLSFENFEGNSFENSKGNSKRCDLDCARMVAGSRHLEILV